jgi:hypothetical protein
MNTTTTNMPSICIPRVFPNIDEKRIRKIFGELQIGTIELIDIVNKKTEKGENFNRVFIHFNSWYNNANANQVRTRLLEGKEIKIIYDDPWFWKVSAYRVNPNKIDNKTNNNKANNNKTINNKPKPMIIFDEDSNPKKQELPRLPVTVFKPRVLTNKPIKIEKSVKIEKTESIITTQSNDKIDYGEMTLPPKKQKRSINLPLPLKNPPLLKIEEEEVEVEEGQIV